MEWYYVSGGNRVGPVGDSELATLVQQGVVGPDTHVWNQGMKDWQTYGTVAGVPAVSTQPAVCTVCGKTVPAEDVIRFEGATVCATCKPTFVQQLKEGTAQTTALNLASIGNRFVAVFIDGIILSVAFYAIKFAVLAGMAGAGQQDIIVGATIALSLGQVVAQACYEIIMLGKYGATLGKMAMHIKVVSPDGSPISYGRATGRYFAKILSGLILYIGFIMAFFDKEKRALHDQMCNTRVIRA